MAMNVVELDNLKTKDRAYYEAIKSALVESGGKLAPASRKLGVSLPTARKYAIRFGLWPIRSPAALNVPPEILDY